MAFDLAKLKAQAEEAERAAKAAELSEEEQAVADELARIAKAKEDRAAAERVRRSFDRVEREQAARSLLPPGVLVKGLDLLEFFPLGEGPDPALLPTGGVIVVRSPEREHYNRAAAELEHKKRPMAEILADLLIESTVDPDPKDAKSGAVMRALCDAFPGAATMAGDEVYKLGGARARADKRGRA